MVLINLKLKVIECKTKLIIRFIINKQKNFINTKSFTYMFFKLQYKLYAK